jgi:1-phosphatidylinositol phosphodiesterase
VLTSFRCQDQSIIQQLNAGMRAFDLRIGIAPDGQSLTFFHAAAVLSTTATFADVMYGFYHFLHEHPSETIMLSVKVSPSSRVALPRTG